MRIFEINSCSNSGSTGRISIDLARVINANGHSCFLAYGRGSIPADIYGYQITTKFQLYRHGVMSRITDRSGFYSRGETEKLISVIEEYQPDIIHLHNIHGYYLNIELLFSWIQKTNIPIIWTFHDCWPYTGHCAYYDFMHCDKWIQKECSGVCPEKHLYPASYLKTQSNRNYLDKKRIFPSVSNITIVTPSVWLADEIKKSFLKNYPIRVIPNGVDQEVFCKRESSVRGLYGIENKKIVLGVANYWNKYKGLNDFVALSGDLDDNFIIVLIGMEKKQFDRLPPNIIGIERTTSIQELAEWYATSDVFVNPTYVDNFPTTNIEALSCGTPVITYRTGGSIEAADEETGSIVDQGDIKSLRKEIIDWCRKTKPSEACIRRAEIFEKNKSFKAYLDLYQEVLQNAVYDQGL